MDSISWLDQANNDPPLRAAVVGGCYSHIGIILLWKLLCSTFSARELFSMMLRPNETSQMVSDTIDCETLQLDRYLNATTNGTRER